MAEVRISRLQLAQFRSYTQARLDLDGRPVVLVGPNGSGKTSILEAVSMFSPGRGMRRAAPAELACRRHGAGWQVAASLEAGDRNWKLATRFEGGAGRKVNIEGKPARQTDLGKLLRIVWVVPAMDRLWSEGSEGRRKFLDRMALSFFPSHAEDVIAYEKAMRERNRLIRERRRIAGWLDGLERQMAQKGAAINQSRIHTVKRLENAIGHSSNEFPGARLKLTGPDGSDSASIKSEELESSLRTGRERDFAAGRTLVGPHRADMIAIHAEREMEARRCSTGEQKALLLSIVLANARAISEDCGGPPLLLLDEISAHLDAVRRDALYRELQRLDAQAWLTGTQRDLFDAIGASGQWFEVSETDGQSAIAPLDAA